jgi:hypothetical protein
MRSFFVENDGRRLTLTSHCNWLQTRLEPKLNENKKTSPGNEVAVSSGTFAFVDEFGLYRGWSSGGIGFRFNLACDGFSNH